MHGQLEAVGQVRLAKSLLWPAKNFLCLLLRIDEFLNIFEIWFFVIRGYSKPKKRYTVCF